jgi:putative methyltransferase (TIGR04325 family)
MLFDASRRSLDYLRPAPWEYVPEAWQRASQLNEGWNLPTIAQVEKLKWPAYLGLTQGKGPLGVNHEAVSYSDSTDVNAHNTNMIFGYVLALAARNRKKLSVLDWGGGIGHYYVLSRALVPDIEIDYYCADLPAFCSVGRELLPGVTFLDLDDRCLDRQYDLVFASSSLWYEEKWKPLLAKLAASARDYLYVTRMLFVGDGPSFVALQRPWAAGYRTQYLCWIFNRRELIEAVETSGLRLLREFFLGPGPHIHKAPEQADFRGFLFQRGNKTAI